MSNILKIIVMSFLVLIALVLIGNFYITVGNVEQGSEQVAGVNAEIPEIDVFIAKTYSYEDRLVFTYVPRDSGKINAYYADCQLPPCE
ncbi:hypothetical protein [Methanolobus halotolerans]|uniref:Uncharacterized protein n=1 Tax=Methanolobus halotolerans TaxID=2052935 RepID=A0A4E0PVN1_9EURY|nr:hypothetical protein [Methanolobus halotolerans]TGC08174.1 hypothetical protein CUN85_10205 [Methanolobus halotolerans]